MTDDGKVKSISISYEKAEGHRTVHADGIWGGATPQGMVSVTFFTERPSFPLNSALTLAEDGSVMATQDNHGPYPFTRTLEATAIMNIPTSIALMHWLRDKVDSMIASGQVTAEAVKELDEIHAASFRK